MGNCVDKQVLSTHTLSRQWASDSPQLGEIIATGQFSEIRSAVDQCTIVATKCVKVTDIGKDLHGFRSQVKKWRSLNHLNIVKCYSLNMSPETIYITLELCEGGTLKQQIKKGQVKNLLSIAQDILEALQYIHMRNVVHGCIKPSHILLSRGSAKLTDFCLTNQSQVSYFLSPEALLGELTSKADIWSFGVVLYQATTGKLPFNGISAEEIAMEINGIQPPFECVPVEFRELIQSMLNKEPEKRPDATQALAMLKN